MQQIFGPGYRFLDHNSTDFADHDQNPGTGSSNPAPSSGESDELPPEHEVSPDLDGRDNTRRAVMELHSRCTARLARRAGKCRVVRLPGWAAKIEGQARAEPLRSEAGMVSSRPHRG
jgi:hypothetical protein